MGTQIAFAAFQKSQSVSFLWLIALFPLIGAAVNGIAGKWIQDRYGKRAVHGIAVGAMALAALVALYGFVKLLAAPAGERVLHDDLFPMLEVGDFRVHFAFAMDQLSGVMAVIITVIGGLIHVYSTGYMADEDSYWRFFCYLNLFVFSMLLLVLGDTFILMFFGWEGVGLCSYLLIGFWYKDFLKATAGMKAFVVNRIGDFAFITGLFLLFWGLGGNWASGEYRPHPDYAEARPGIAREDVSTRVQEVLRVDPSHYDRTEGPTREQLDAAETTTIFMGGTVSFQELKQQVAYTLCDAQGEICSRPRADDLQNQEVFGIPLVFLICLCFFIGACGKSAQIPLYVWLPDAMAGPTPVSALIHAATMVTAGVYMIARLNFLFFLSPGAMTVVAFVGACTALFAATIGLFQYDIKKVLAYSTVSQLGFMFIGVGVGAWWAGVFHLLTHACFKACLFLGSGSVIHGMHFLQHHGHDDHGHGHDEHGEDEHDAHGHGHGAAQEEAPEPAKPHPELRHAPDPTDPQDMRNMGGLAALMPKTRLTYLIACISIAGFPIAAGFYSKDEILWKAMSNGATLIPGWLIWLIGFAAAGCTSFYMFRSYYMTFYRRPPTDDIRKHCHESPGSMTYVLWALAIAAVVTGLLGLPHLIFPWHPAFESWLGPVTAEAPFRAASGFISSHTLEAVLILMSIGIATAGWLLARFFYRDESVTAARMARLRLQYDDVHETLYNKYWVDELYQATFVRGFRGLARICAWVDAHMVDWMVNAVGWAGRGAAEIGGWIDKMFVDGAVNGVANGIVRLGREGRRLQTGRINNYAVVIALGALFLALVTCGSL